MVNFAENPECFLSTLVLRTKGCPCIPYFTGYILLPCEGLSQLLELFLNMRVGTDGLKDCPKPLKERIFRKTNGKKCADGYT